MFQFYHKIKSSLLFSTFILIVLCLQVDCNDGGETSKSKDVIVKEDVDKFLTALEKFDRTNSSFVALTTAIRNFFQIAAYKRKDELGALLYAYASLRPSVFPETVFRRIYGTGQFRKRIDVVIRRVDGTLFVIRSLSDPAEIVDKMKKKGDKGVNKYKGFKGDVSNVVMVELGWQLSKDGKNMTFKASYVCDNFDKDAPPVDVILEQKLN